MKYLIKLADDNNQLNRTLEVLLNNNTFNNDDVYKYTNELYSSWKNANEEGYIDEHYMTFSDWLQDYVIAISQDIISQAKNNDAFSRNYLLLTDSDKDILVDKLNAFILEKSDDIYRHIKQS